MNIENIKKLINIAKDMAKKNDCCSHTNFTVGSALMTETGEIYTGFNIENDGIQSICAERSAFVKALTEGKKNFKCIAIVGKKITDKNFKKTLPCGYCLQFLSEYTNPDFVIYTYDDIEDKIYRYELKDLQPCSFNLE